MKILLKLYKSLGNDLGENYYNILSLSIKNIIIYTLLIIIQDIYIDIYIYIICS